ncbi:MAG: MoaD/ThiS family protein [Candidatus Aminicenantes bacterium]|nr:MAG: MoaD/ThiS family protein [Candidatus Aminicenantes bacterium]
MKINVEFLSMPIVTKIVGSKTLSLDFPGETIDDLINQVVNTYGHELRRFLLDESSKLDRAFMIHLNKKEWIRRDQLNKTLKDGDQVTLMMLVGGG